MTTDYVGRPTSRVDGQAKVTGASKYAANMLGLAIEDVTFNLGDSSLRTSPVKGDSWTTPTNGSAIKNACDAVGQKLFNIAQGIDGYSFADANFEDVTFADGNAFARTCI